MLAKMFVGTLEQLIDYCLKREKGENIYTPSDYGLNPAVTYQELDSFFAETRNGKSIKEQIDSIYRLSGLQQGMLFHGLYDSSGSYIEQFACDLVGVNLDALLSSWSSVIQNHSILRSAFYYDTFSIPVQCVFREVTLPLEQLDYRRLDDAALAEALDAYESADRVKGFDFKSAPLMRLALIRITDNRYRMVWTSHHLLFDGWSMPILIEEFLNTYDLLVSAKALPVAQVDRYEDYIRYLERLDKEAAEDYWRNYLNEIEQGTLLPFIRKTERTKGIGEYRTLPLHFDGVAIEQINKYAQANRLTINTLMQGAWAWLLHQYTGNREVSYGVIVSGRPAELPDVEQRVGMYINTLVLKAIADPGEETSVLLQNI